MKHIIKKQNFLLERKFANPEFTKYVIFKNAYSKMIIYEIIDLDLDKDFTIVKKLYTYPPLKKNEDVLRATKVYRNIYEYKSIIYKTNNLQDALKILPLIDDAKKYNL